MLIAVHGLLVCVVSWIVATQASLGADYANPACADHFCNDAHPGIDALIHGDIGRFFDDQPEMGPFSLLVRAPFAALARFGAETPELVFQLGLFPLVAAGGFLGVYLAHVMRDQGVSPFGWVPVAVVCMYNPLTSNAIDWGHPEEMLGGSLCAAAVVLAARGRGAWAGLLLGFALATKQWALLAVVPVAFAAPAEQRVRALAIALAVGVALVAPMAIGNPDAFYSANNRAAGAFKVHPQSLWWPVSTYQQVGETEDAYLYGQGLPDWLEKSLHPLIVFLPLPLGLLYWRRRTKPDWRVDAVLLLTLLMLLRSVLDSLSKSYYNIPFLLALASWEAARGRRFPYATMAATVGFYGIGEAFERTTDGDILNAIFLGVTLPFVAYAAVNLYRGGATTAESTA